MSNYVEKNIQCILTSPPYNLTPRKGGISDSGRYDVYTDWMTEEQYIKWTLNVFKNFNNVLKDDGVVLYNFSYGIENPALPYTLVVALQKYSNFTLIDTIIWEKYSGMPFPANKYRLSRKWEYVYVFVKKGMENNYTNNRNVKTKGKNNQNYYEVVYNYIKAKNNDGQTQKINQATFSTDLCTQLLNIYTREGDIVYDPFIGTGTTAMACLQNKRRCIGTEISLAQVEYANQRLKNELPLDI